MRGGEAGAWVLIVAMGWGTWGLIVEPDVAMGWGTWGLIVEPEVGGHGF